MQIIQLFLNEIEHEAQTTRKMLQRVPDGKYDWQPHPKSMTLGRLAGHIAELPGWVPMTINTAELDFQANAYTPPDVNNNEELMAYFENNLTAARATLAATDEEELNKLWTLRSGKDVYSVRPKADVIRMSISQTIHHRAQLGVYLRLLSIPIPGSYGPSADEPEFAVQEQA